MTIDDAQLEDFRALAKARAFWGQGRLDDALAAFEHALRERPSNVKALLEAARAFGGRHEIARAEAYLDRARSLAGDDRRVAPLIAQSYARIFRPRRAIELLQDLPDAPPPVLAELATLYEQMDRLEDALNVIERCISAAPSAAAPRVLKGRILRRLQRGDAAKTALKPFVDHPEPSVQAEAWTELCYVLEAQGDADGAADAIERAHQVARDLPQTAALAAQGRANNAALLALANAIDASVFERWRSECLEPDPRVGAIAHLIGFPRSGTTLLEQRLDAHPGLADSPERVVFARDVFPRLCRAGGGALSVASLASVSPVVLAQERRRYVDYMEATLGEPIGGRVHLDKNPNHTSLLPGLFRLFPESRFVVALRDPRDVVTSCVMRSFALTEFSAMMLDWRSACELYAFEMSAWLHYKSCLDRSQWIEIRYEDVVEDVATKTKETLEFLGLDWREDIAFRDEHMIEKMVNSPTQTEARKPVYRKSIGRWRAHRSRLAPHIGVLRPFIDAFGYD